MAVSEGRPGRSCRSEYAADWPAWGHRKIAAMMRVGGHQVSTSTVERALRRRGVVLLPSGFRADRRSWSRLRKRVFRDPPRERNRVWQMDFSEFETARGGIWRICAVIDHATKYCLAATVTPTSRGADALTCLLRAVDEANGSSTSTTSALTVGRRTWSTPSTSSSARFPHPSHWSPTTAPASWRHLRRGVHRRRPAA
ncbi:MAG TPA: hypothetical protein VNB91_13735 [Jatrophihabitantaceae bacterium]|nr:hypothetical protein [Jatrophihabitantaceae bacterium]